MKRLFLATTIISGLASTAFAADLPRRTLAPAPFVSAVPTFAWTGFYVGAQIGHAWGEDQTRLFFDGVLLDLASVGVDTSYDVDGLVGGGHVGYNYQIGSVVVGIEGDLEAAGIDGKRTLSDSGFSTSASTEIDFQGSVRGRLGVAFDRTLIYATGGFAFANIANTYSVTIPGVVTLTEKAEDTEWGWTLGAGLEYAFTNNLTTRIEYRFTKFDSFRNNSALLAPLAAEQEPEFHTVRAGVSYKF